MSPRFVDFTSPSSIRDSLAERAPGAVQQVACILQVHPMRSFFASAT
jgi:hypothetical protein